MLTQTTSDIPHKVWLLFAAGPTLFLVAIVFASIFLSMRGVNPEQIAQRVPLLMPHILLGVLLCLGVLTHFALQAETVWVMPDAKKALADVGFGLLVGVALALVYFKLLAPLLEVVQRAVGDYVPPGSVLPTVSSSLGLFFIANVLLAPLVEETIYRGYALPLLTTHVGVTWAVVITCIFFGLLHWPGGFWYMLLTGAVAGGAFAGLSLWRGGILAPFAAHLALNVIEFVYVWRAHEKA